MIVQDLGKILQELIAMILQDLAVILQDPAKNLQHRLAKILQDLARSCMILFKIPPRSCQDLCKILDMGIERCMNGMTRQFQKFINITSSEQSVLNKIHAKLCCKDSENTES